MKKLFILFTVLSVVLTAQAQTAFGIKAGLNLSNQSSKADNQKDVTNLKAGMVAGLFVQLPAGKHLSIQPELLFSQMGGTEKDADLEATLTSMFDYISIPVTARFKTGIADFYLGPQVAFLISAKAKYEGGGMTEKADIKDGFKSMDFSGVAGVGVGLGAGIFLDARYQKGFTNLYKDGDSQSWFRNNGFQITLAYKFFKHKK